MNLNCEFVNYLLTTYTTDDINSEADMDMMNFEQPAGQARSNMRKYSRQKSCAADLSLMTTLWK